MLQRLLILALLAFAPLVGAQDFQPGRDYFPIEPAQPTASGDRIEVIEVFGYPCIHCAHAAPVITKWRETLPADVQFRLVPAVFGAVWEAYGRAFYTAETMGVLERTHDKLFEVVHGGTTQIRNLDDIAAFYAGYGVDKEAFLATMKSFAVDAKIAEAHRIVPLYGVEGTPTMIVAGKYRVVAPAGDGSFEKMLAVVDFLIAKERAAKSAG